MNEARLHKLLLGLTVVMAAVLSASAALLTPALEAPDEPAHYYFVQYLWTRRALPVLELNHQGLSHPQYENYQPPAYYVFALLAAPPVGSALSTPLRLEANPFTTDDLTVLNNDNQNGILPDDDEDAPYTGTPRAVRGIRLASVALGVINALLLLKLGSALFERDDERLAYSAIALLIPGAVFSMGVINNDNMAALAGTLITLYGLKLTREPDVRAHWLALALAVALATLSKMSMAGFAPAVLIAAAVAWRFSGDRRALAWNVLLSGGIWLALSGWWFWRNLTLYGELTGIQRMKQLAAVPGAHSLSYVLDVWPLIWQSFWGRLAGQHFPLPWPAYEIFSLLTMLSLAGWIWLLIRRTRIFHPGWWVLAAALAGMIGIVILYVMDHGNGLPGRFFYPALGSIAALMVAGLLALAPAGLRRWVCYGVWGVMMAIASLSIWHWLPSAYALPPRLARLDPPPGFIRLDYQYGDSIRLHGLTLSSVRASPGDRLAVTLYWEAQRAVETNEAVFLQLVDSQSNKVAQRNTYSGNGMYPPKRWKPGEIVVDSHTLWIDPNAPAPHLYHLIGGLWNLGTGERLPVRAEAPVSAAPYQLGEIVVAPGGQGGALPPDAVVLAAEFGGGIALRGCALDETPGEVTLYWAAAQEVTRDYTVLVHVWDQANTFALGLDHPPMQGRFPSRFWKAGDWIADRFALPGSVEAARLDVGLYAGDTLERLPLLSPPLPDHLFTLPEVCWRSPRP